MSFQDLKLKIRLRAGEKLAEANQGYESLVIVVSKALGGKSKGSAPVKAADPKTMPQTTSQLEATLNKHFGRR